VESVDRRSFFKHAGAVTAVAAVAGTVGVTPLAFVGKAGAAVSSHESELTLSEALRGDEHLIAHVKNARTGEVALFIGAREVTIRDRKLAARLVRAIR